MGETHRRKIWTFGDRETETAVVEVIVPIDADAFSVEEDAPVALWSESFLDDEVEIPLHEARVLHARLTEMIGFVGTPVRSTDPTERTI